MRATDPTADSVGSAGSVHEVQRPPTVVDHIITPVDLTGALEAMAQPGARPIAGGTDLLVELDRGQHRDLATLVDLSRIPGLDRITVESGPGRSPMVTIGPLVTHNQCATSELIRGRAPLLAQASWEVGSPQLRNRATVVGNVVTASPANDTLSPLVALGAVVTVASAGGERRLPIEDFHLGVRRTALADDELVTAISFPALGPSARSIYLKLGLRRAQAISVVHVAAVVELDDDGLVLDARLALGSVAPTIVRAVEAERMLVGRPLGQTAGSVTEAVARAAVEAVEPIDDLRASADYRKTMVGQTVTKALAALDLDRGLLPPLTPTLAGPRLSSGPEATVEHGPSSAIEATVNDETVSGPGVGATLLHWLHDRGLTGTKEGCAEGECGACTVHLDGAAVLSCLVPATRAHHGEVTTIEGLAGSDGDGAEVADLHRLQTAFVQTGAVQCGYCIPGFLMSGAKLLDEHPNPDNTQIKNGLSGNLCRCTGYYKIEDAVRVAIGGDGP